MASTYDMSNSQYGDKPAKVIQKKSAKIREMLADIEEVAPTRNTSGGAQGSHHGYGCVAI